ncbi:hypothetical protein RXV95_06600 [Novosphingobium sp. ZN18A2]|uniref:hypothetical protein n=1 Tax=Novosphingobium sp. ZN18A2 TaxID=3079861 RepID=UPI0030CB8255
MIASLVALTLAASSPAIAHADAANEAYWSCMFATARSARQRHVAADRISAELDKACQSERAQLRTAFVGVQRERGMSATDAQESWADLDARGRNAIERTFVIPDG